MNASRAFSMTSRAICSLSSNASCAIFCAVISRTTLAAPITAPDCDRIGAMPSDTSIHLLFLSTRTVSRYSIFSPARMLSRMSCASPRSGSGTMISIRLPIASFAVNPNSRSAAGFQPVMIPSSVSVMIASLDDSTAAMNSCSCSNVRRRPSISRLSAAVFARDSAAISAKALASTPIS